MKEAENRQPGNKEENPDFVVSWNPTEKMISNRAPDYWCQGGWGEENGTWN